MKEGYFLVLVDLLKDVGNSRVEQSFVKCSVVDGFLDVLRILTSAAGHTQVQTGSNTERSLVYRTPVRHNEALVAPFVP